MKTITGLLVGVAMLVSASASAQYYGQATVSGEVLSYGPRGFILQGPDGNYGIAVGGNTVVTDPASYYVATGPGTVQPGEYVTATGYPTSQWIMRATRVVVHEPQPYGYYGPYNNGQGVYYGNGMYQSPSVYNPVPGVTTFTPVPLQNPYFPGSITIYP